MASAAWLERNVSVDRMARILLVEDDEDWLDLISEALPQHKVDKARSYEAATEALRKGAVYDVAIVDLNLVRPHGLGARDVLRGIRDMLGGDILEQLRKDYPQTRRIALTGLPPGKVRGILERYDLYDLLLKNDMTVPAVQELMRAAIEHASDAIPVKARTERTEQKADFDRWCGKTAGLLDEQIRRLTSDIERDRRSSGRWLPQEIESNRAKMSKMQAKLAGLESHRGVLERGRAKIDAMLADAKTAEDIVAVRLAIDALKGEMEQRFAAEG